MGQLEDPLVMVFTRAMTRENFLTFMADSSWYILEVCLVKYYDDILVSKRHTKWVVYLHMAKVLMDVHKW